MSLHYDFVPYPMYAANMRLSLAEKAVLIAICANGFYSKTNDITVSDRVLAREANVAYSKITNIKKSLRDKGIISFERGAGNRTCYHIMPQLELSL